MNKEKLEKFVKVVAYKEIDGMFYTCVMGDNGPVWLSGYVDNREVWFDAGAAVAAKQQVMNMIAGGISHVNMLRNVAAMETQAVSVADRALVQFIKGVVIP